MERSKKPSDPYRELGLARAATEEQIKAAHRRLAKRHHPDAPGGDTQRFLAIQEAYLLLSDPLRRREWDARHAPGPVVAGEAVTRRTPRARGSDGRWTREDGAAGGRERTRATRRSGSARAASPNSGAGGSAGSAAGAAAERGS